MLPNGDRVGFIRRVIGDNKKGRVEHKKKGSLYVYQ